MTGTENRGSATASPAFIALGCVGFIASAPALAQTPAPAGEEEGTELQGVTVTATAIEDGSYKVDRVQSPKFTAPLIDTPRSVTVIPSQVIRDTGSTTLMEALRTVPGITMGAGEGGNPLGDRPFIRGFDSQNSTYLDGVRDIGAQSREIFAIEQVEVVKGSGSAVAGRGSAGGTLNLVSKMPKPETFVAGSASYGNADYKRVTADLNFRASELVGFRLNAMWHDQDVAGRDALYQKRWGIAPSVTIGVEGPTSLTAMYYHMESDELPDSGIPYKYTIGNAPAGVTRTGPVTEVGGQKVDLDNFYGLKARDFRDTKVDQVTLRAQHAFSDALTVRNTARYGRSSQSYIWTNPDDSAGNVVGTGTAATAQPGGRVARSPKSRFGYTELWVDQLDLFGSFDTGPAKHSFSAGLELAYEKADRGAYTIVSTPRCPTNAGANGSAPGAAPFNCTSLFDPNPNDPWNGSVVRGAPDSTTITDASTKSAYAFDTISFNDVVLVNLGLRYDDFRTDVRLPTTRQRLRRDDGIWSYQAGLVFKPAANASLYASFATSNTPPGSFVGEGQDPNTFSATVAPDSLKVEKTKSYEIGAKWNLFQDALALTLAGFRTETKNARATSDANTVVFIGERRIEGIEFGFNGNITPEWNVFGGYTYMDSKIVDGGFTITALNGVNFAAPSVNTGKPFPNTPKHSLTAFTNYQVTPALKIGGGAIHNSRVYGGYGDTRVVQNGAVVVTKTLDRYVPGYWRFDLNASFKVTEAVELSVNVQNLTDKRYFDRAYSTHYASIAPGRLVFGTVNFRF